MAELSEKAKKADKPRAPLDSLKTFLRSGSGAALLRGYLETGNLKTSVRKRDTRDALVKIDAIFNELQEATGQA